MQLLTLRMLSSFPLVRDFRLGSLCAFWYWRIMLRDALVATGAEVATYYGFKWMEEPKVKVMVCLVTLWHTIP